jgi:hypothetical protein
MRSSKVQHPSSREISNTKHHQTAVLEFGAWSFSGAWMLVLGA